MQCNRYCAGQQFFRFVVKYGGARTLRCSVQGDSGETQKKSSLLLHYKTHAFAAPLQYVFLRLLEFYHRPKTSSDKYIFWL